MKRISLNDGEWYNEAKDKSSIWIGKTNFSDANELFENYLGTYNFYDEIYEDDPEEKLYDERSKYEKFYEPQMINTALGEDFMINSFELYFAVLKLLKANTNDTRKLFKDRTTSYLEKAVEMLGEKLDDEYNVVISLDDINYTGNIKEVYNEKYGYFKFIGVFSF